MIVVSDTSALNYLILLGEVDILAALFQRVVAPQAVITELRHPDAPSLVSAWAATPPTWLEIATPQPGQPQLSLGPGERDAVLLAQELNADAILMDERKATSVARRLGLTVIGTLAILDLAAERGLLDLKMSIEALRQTTFRGPAAVMDELLRRDEARRSRGPGG